MKNEVLHKLCRGCKSHGIIEFRNGGKLFHRTCMIENPVLSPIDQCPCINCILKVMCNNICDDFIDFITLEAKSRENSGVRQ